IFQVSVCDFLKCGIYFLRCRLIFERTSKIGERSIEYRHPYSRTAKLTLKVGKYVGNRFSGSGCRGNDGGRGGTSPPKIPVRRVVKVLVACHAVDRRNVSV